MASDELGIAAYRVYREMVTVLHMSSGHLAPYTQATVGQIARNRMMQGYPHDVLVEAYRQLVETSAVMARALGIENELHRETVHECPPDGSGIMPCCGRTPLEVPTTDRLTANVNLVTCRDGVDVVGS